MKLTGRFCARSSYLHTPTASWAANHEKLRHSPSSYFLSRYHSHLHRTTRQPIEIPPRLTAPASPNSASRPPTPAPMALPTLLPTAATNTTTHPIVVRPAMQSVFECRANRSVPQQKRYSLSWRGKHTPKHTPNRYSEPHLQTPLAINQSPERWLARDMIYLSFLINLLAWLSNPYALSVNALPFSTGLPRDIKTEVTFLTSVRRRLL